MRSWEFADLGGGAWPDELAVAQRIPQKLCAAAMV